MPGPIHNVLDCPQNPTLTHIQDSLKRLESHSARTADAMEKMAANSATIESHTLQLRQHDAAFVEIFNRLRDFEKKQDGDFRGNVARIAELEKAQAIDAAVDEVVEKVEEKKEKAAETKERFLNGVKVEMIHPILTLLLVLWAFAEKLGLFEVWERVRK